MLDYVGLGPGFVFLDYLYFDILSRDFYFCNNGLLVWDWTTIGQRWDVSPGCMPQ